MTAYDRWLDKDMPEDEDTEDWEAEPEEWDGPYPEDELGYYEN
jgi:hypothetical protein